MWQSGKEQTDGYVADADKSRQQFDSGNVDSGFLSGTNIVSSEQNLECDSGAPSSGPVAPEPAAPEPMRADSGVGLGLSESFSHLSLKQVTLNPLSGKVQSEPTIELTPVTSKITQQQPRPVQDKQTFSQEPWQLYYSQDDDGDTQLHIAIVQGFLEAAFSLVRMAPHPCLLDILNDDCQSPLHLAVMTHQSRIARLLVLAGANPAIRDARGNTALHISCASGDLACAKALTDPLSPMERRHVVAGRPAPALPQDLEQRNYDGEMCLHIAASEGQVEMVRLLLRLGADLEAREGLSGRTALHLAVERRRTTVIAFLLEDCAPLLDAPTYAGITAYQIAACMDTQLARKLIRMGATPQPPPESDSESSDDSEDEGSPYLAQIAQMRQSIGVHA